MNKGVPSSRDPRNLIQIVEEDRMQERNEVIGLFIVVVEVVIIVDEDDTGLQSHAIVACEGKEQRTISSNDTGRIEERLIFKVNAEEQKALRVEITAVEEHPINVKKDQPMGELKVDMPPLQSNITARWFQLRPLKG